MGLRGLVMGIRLCHSGVSNHQRRADGTARRRVGHGSLYRTTGLIPAAVGRSWRKIEAQSREASAMQRLSQCVVTETVRLALALALGHCPVPTGRQTGAPCCCIVWCPVGDRGRALMVRSGW